MGACLSAYAIKGKPPAAVQRALGLRATAKPGNYHESRFSGAMTPTGWYLVCQRRHEATAAEMGRLSEGCEAAACFVEEHVMFSSASGWKDGREIWCVVHEAARDSTHLEVRGTPPPRFAAIRDELFAKQTLETCDYIFDIPVSVFADLTGFRHDARAALEFEALERPSWFARMFRG
jgi:hypothetical protein